MACRPVALVIKLPGGLYIASSYELSYRTGLILNILGLIDSSANRNIMISEAHKIATRASGMDICHVRQYSGRGYLSNVVINSQIEPFPLAAQAVPRLCRFRVVKRSSEGVEPMRPVVIYLRLS